MVLWSVPLVTIVFGTVIAYPPLREIKRNYIRSVNKLKVAGIVLLIKQ